MVHDSISFCRAERPKTTTTTTTTHAWDHVYLGRLNESVVAGISWTVVICSLLVSVCVCVCVSLSSRLVEHVRPGQSEKKGQSYQPESTGSRRCDERSIHIHIHSQITVEPGPFIQTNRDERESINSNSYPLCRLG
jgi:hypothetical protein